MISPEELAGRRARVRDHAVSLGASGFVVFDPTYLGYLTGFRFLSNERPIAYAETASGEHLLFLPEFEVERTRAEASFERIAHYPDYPGREHPMRILARALADLGLRGRIAADADGYPGILGYQGPALSEVTGAEVVPLADRLEWMIARKSPAEIELIRESGRWCARAHRLLQERSLPGATEAEVSLGVQRDVTLELLAELGEVGWNGSGDGVKAGYRGQIGLRSAWAHAVAHVIPFAAGDVLVSETGARIWGYSAELERAMVIGAPTDEQRRLFEHMLGARQAAFDALRPGATCAEVDEAVERYFDEHGLRSHWRQHTGHAIGLRDHEAPFLDVGDTTVMEPGMVFTIEPGVYDPAVGGFRHSDTVAITDGGYELLTDYPDELEQLTIPR